MTYRYISTSLCLGLLCLMSFASASAEESPQTIGEFVLQMPAITSRPVVNYCASEQPDLRDALIGGHKNFTRKILEAAKPLTEHLLSDQDFATPVPPETRAQVEQIGEAMLTQVKKGDSATHCNMIMVRMRDATVEQLRARIMEMYEGYRQRTPDSGAGERDAPP